MRLHRLALLLTILWLMTSVSAQSAEDYNQLIQTGDMSIGLKTSAPLSQDALAYEYREDLNVVFDVFISDIPDSVASSIAIDIHASTLGDTMEISYFLETVHAVDFFRAGISSIIIGADRIILDQQNISRQIISLPAEEQLTIQFFITGEYNQFQLQQVTAPVNITFSAFSPVSFEVGALDFDTWQDNILPLAIADAVVLPLAAIGATVYTLQAGVKSMGQKVGNMADTAKEVVEDNQKVVDTVRATKEAVDFGTDAKLIHDDLERDKNWLTKLGKMALSIYLILLTLSITASFVNQLSSYEEVIQETYTYYTAGYMLVLLGVVLLSVMRPSILAQVGDLIPNVHMVIILLAIATFILSPLVYLMSVLTPDRVEVIRDMVLISLISFGFILTTLFAGYFLARSGESWARIIQTGMRKIGIPQGIVRLVIRVFTLGFFVILLFRLIKTMALIFTVLVENQLSENAYLVSLAASYLKNEMTGSLVIVYGLLLIFFLQTIMEVYLHIRKKEVDENIKTLPIYRTYRRLALFLLVSVLTFLHLIIILEAKLEELGIGSTVYPQEAVNSLDVFNILFAVPPFRVLLDIMLAIGLLLALPFVFFQMWKTAVVSSQQPEEGDEGAERVVSDETEKQKEDLRDKEKKSQNTEKINNDAKSLVDQIQDSNDREVN